MGSRGMPGTPGHWEVPVALPDESCVVITYTGYSAPAGEQVSC